MGGYCGRLMAACAAMLSPASGSLVISSPRTGSTAVNAIAIGIDHAGKREAYLRVDSCQPRCACYTDWDERRRKSDRLDAGD